jgi:hypothetical protein
MTIALLSVLAAGLLLGWLHFRKRQPATALPTEAAIRLHGNGRYDFGLVGVSRYLLNLEKIYGTDHADDEGKVVDAVLILDNNNAKDKNAVRVEVQGQTVGYLPPDLAKAYRRRLQEGAYLNARGICKARITSRMYRSIGADYVIRLDLPEKK